MSNSPSQSGSIHTHPFGSESQRRDHDVHPDAVGEAGCRTEMVLFTSPESLPVVSEEGLRAVFHYSRAFKGWFTDTPNHG